MKEREADKKHKEKVRRMELDQKAIEKVLATNTADHVTVDCCGTVAVVLWLRISFAHP